MNTQSSGTPESRVLEIGSELLAESKDQTGSIFNKNWWYGKIMDWSMKNDQFKTQMFRFVDVLPNLESSKEVVNHMREYFSEFDGNSSIKSLFSFSTGIGSVAPGVVASAIKKNVKEMAKMFITGATPEEALVKIEQSRLKNITFTADLLGEATLSEVEAQNYLNRYLELIEKMSTKANSWPANQQIDQDHTGDIPKVNISVKLTSLYSQIKIEDWDNTKSILKDKLRIIFDAAIKKSVFVNIDMESYKHKNLTLEVFKELLDEENYKKYNHFGIVIQAYLVDSKTDLIKLIEWTRQRATPISVRLVKGAYWDYEVIHAKQQNWPIPVYTDKAKTDSNFEDCCQLILESEVIKLALASHNARSIAYCIAVAEKLNIPKNSFEIQMLFGMAHSIKNNVIAQGYRLREYATIGDLIPGMAYLVRRLLENTSNESFLRSKDVEQIELETLLKDPREMISPESETIIDSKFINKEFLDFSIQEYRDNLSLALKKEGEKKPIDVFPIINGKKTKSKNTITSINPSHPNHVLANIHLASVQDAELALNTCTESFKKWSQTTPKHRAVLLRNLSKTLDSNKFSLMATIIHEVGKTWVEADGDVAEAIDFCEYYANEIERVGEKKRVGNVPGEVSYYSYRPKGVALVIAPWNFPLAILAGMSTAALAAGNTVIMKPAEQSSLVAHKLMELMLEAGIPKNVISFLPGKGEEVGEHLVKHDKVNIICFTGSKDVGLHIFKNAGQTMPNQKNVKTCIIEMGGKNSLIIDNDADLDEAIEGALHSAFGFSGQKCSAGGKIIVLEDVYSKFTQRLEQAAKSLTLGFSESPKSYMGPVIDQEALDKHKAIIEQAKKDSTLLYKSSSPQEGYFTPIHIFTDVKSESDLAQNEVFGPVLAIIKAKSIKEALTILNNSEYGLTGGIYSRSPANIEYAKNTAEVGNFYVNRNITGALVDRHPFGGFKMSGVGSKAGGPDYLIQFMEPQLTCENTLRRGFAPEE